VVASPEVESGPALARARWHTQDSGAAFDRKKADSLADDARAFIALQSLCVAAGLGADGNPDGALVWGGPGFVETPDARTCRLRVDRHATAGLLGGLANGRAAWALFFISHPTRERLCVHGAARVVADDGATVLVELVVERSFFHCPKYIATRVAGLSMPSTTQAEHGGWDVAALQGGDSSALSEPARAFLAERDLAFLCTVDGRGQCGVNHRGGAPGYLATRPPSAEAPGGLLFLPDYPGNGAFEAIGNILESGRAMLIVPDYSAQLALLVAGRADVLELAEAPDELRSATGAERLVRIAVERVTAQAADWSASLAYERGRAASARPVHIVAAPAAPAAAAAARVADGVLRVHAETRSGLAEVTFRDGPTVLAKPGDNVLAIALANQVPIEYGCRLGLCGADPVRLLAGEANVSPPPAAERTTLQRLGLPPGCRMACTARVHGPVTVATRLDAAPDEAPAAPSAPPALTFAIRADVRRLVIVGTGIAGVSAAAELRELHPDAEITLLGDEPYDFYNRMLIDRLVAESTSISQLYLMPRDWTTGRRIRFLRGVAATSIDPTRRLVSTDAGETIAYDRLILATGADAFVPDLEGFGMPGTFVLRTIDDAVQLQQYVRRQRCRSAAVIGGGPLGLEAAHSLASLGVRVTVLDRGEWPLARQLDRTAGALLAQLMRDLGVRVLPRAQARRLLGSDRLQAIELDGGEVLNADVCLVATGIKPRTALAAAAGLATSRGILVDDRMQSSNPAIFAAGDVAEVGGQIFGLWPAGVAQAHTAIVNALGGDLKYTASPPPTRLKVSGIDLLAVGTTTAHGEGGQEIRAADDHPREYRKLVLQAGRLVGAMMLGHPELFDQVTDAVAAHRAVAEHVTALCAGDWSML